MSNTRKVTPTANFADVLDIPMTPVESSQFAAYGHDPATGTLAIRFHGYGGGKPGGLYHYPNFGEADMAAFRDAPSKGSHFIHKIKKFDDRYPPTRIVETPAS